MGSQTTHGLPYPVGTDRVMDGDDAIKALAQAVDLAFWVNLGVTNFVIPGTNIRIQNGQINTSGTAQAWSGTVTFPTAFVGSARVVGIQSAAAVVWGFAAASLTGFTWDAVWRDMGSHNGAGYAQWLAIGGAAAV